MEIPSVPPEDLHIRLGYTTPLAYPEDLRSKPLTEHKMEIDDSPIFRYIYRNFRPQRHLEFGTWEGTGCCYCLEESDATVWTINLLEGELKPDGSWGYSTRVPASERPPAWANTQVFGDKRERIVYYQTDALGFIGRHYRDKGLAGRVCQIYCDSRQWDTSNYPDGFFDTVLIDGGHTEEIVGSDTHKAVRLLRSGGIIMWHDFCPVDEVYSKCTSTRGPQDFIRANWDWIGSQMRDIFWINPSWILIGIRK
jgi:hypothetical protein